MLLEFKQHIDPILSPDLPLSFEPFPIDTMQSVTLPDLTHVHTTTQSTQALTDFPDSSTPSRLPDLSYSTLSLKIARQPPPKIVYQRILRPFPVVRLEGDVQETSQNNLFVDATLIKQDSEEEVIPNILEGNKCVRITQGVFSVFKKLKIQATSQQQQTLFRIKFSLKRYLENSFQLIPDATVISEPIEVFSHSLYLDRHDSTKIPPPVINEIVPPLAKVGSRVALLGSNFSNTANTIVALNDNLKVSSQYHEQCTLLFTVPDVMEGEYTLAVSNDGRFFCEGKTILIIK